MTPQEEAIREAKRTGKTVITLTPCPSSPNLIEYTATPKDNGAVELTFKIIKTT